MQTAQKFDPAPAGVMVGRRVRLVKDIPELDLKRGALGTIRSVKPGDDDDYRVFFDARPGMSCGFFGYEFNVACPQFIIEVADA